CQLLEVARPYWRIRWGIHRNPPIADELLCHRTCSYPAQLEAPPSLVLTRCLT
ncbi:unnamed protein product, partial [Closterium sp. Naga37s-1]